MAAPKIAGRAPIASELEQGEYWWCKCGLSGGQPMCDGSHKGTDVSPMPFTLTEKRKVFLCTCKQTKNAPHCDGSHRTLPED